VLRAELLEKTGDVGGALRLLEAVLQRQNAPSALRSRCFTLRGMIAFEAGELQRAIADLNRAVAEASGEGCLRELCWAKLRLFVATSDSSSPASVSRLLSDVRRNVARLADPPTTVALHLFVAECETQRGVLETAARHIRVGTALLENFRNYWLDGIAAIDRLCLSYMMSDPDGAKKYAEDALRLAEHSGHQKTQIAAISNLAHIELAHGQLDRAESLLQRALSLARFSVRARISVLDGLAQLAIARRRHSEARDLLDQIAACAGGELSYGKLWGRLTEARLRMRTADYLGTLAEASTTLDLATTVQDRQLCCLLLLLRAEARAMLGEFPAAAADLVRALGQCDDLPLEVLAEAHRVVGHALDRQGDVAGAQVAYRHSARLLRATGHLRACHEVEAAAQAAALATPHPPADGASVASPGDPAPLAAPAVPPAPARADLVLRRAAALVEQAGRPDLLGPAVVDVVTEVGCASAAAVVSVGAGGDRRVEHRLGWTAAEATAAAASPDPPALALGRWQDREWHLVARVPPTIADRTAWLTIHTLATSGLALAAARREAREREALWPIDNPDTAPPGIFAAEGMRDLLATTRRIAATDVLVLITGETGAGKDVLARILHQNSPRAEKPFVPFNCSAVPRDMLESQLFGYRRGAFTGAQDAFPGVIRAATGGTLFLDEIGEIGTELQPKLLRFLESGEIHPLGEPHPVRVDVRVVAATNQDLDALVRAGRFREDLFYRINVFQLAVPPLRERREEIPLLVQHFLDRFAREHHKGRLRVADETMEYLVLYGWPGNVRQLMNELRRMAALAESDAVLMPEHLDGRIAAARRTRPASERELLPVELVVRVDQPLAAATEHLERAMIQHAMAACNGRVEQVARRLGLSRKGLYLKRQRLGIGHP
jgi:DNA-binding NtrC family response regulator/tetratricopeptide (TPR) repeat protein